MPKVTNIFEIKRRRAEDGFEHISKPIGAVMNNIIDIEARRQLTEQLRGSVPASDPQEEFAATEVKRGRAMMDRGRDIIRKNESTQAALDHLRDSASEIDGSTA